MSETFEWKEEGDSLSAWVNNGDLAVSVAERTPNHWAEIYLPAEEARRFLAWLKTQFPEEE